MNTTAYQFVKMPTITFLNCIGDSGNMIVNVDHFRFIHFLWFGLIIMI